MVPEWAPPSFNSLDGVLFFVGLLFSAAVLALSPRRPTFFQLVTFLAFAALGLKTSRGILWFGLVMAPTLADHLSALAAQIPKRFIASSGRPKVSRALNLVITGLLLLMAIVSLPWFKRWLPLPSTKAGLISAETPVDATRYLLENHLPGPIFHTMSFGSYLVWAAQPDYKVFVDSRIELYPLSVWQDYIAISNAVNGWEDRLDRYGVRTLLLSPAEHSTLIQAAMVSPRWQQVYADPAAVIFVKKNQP
jgi:hypothetical protein